MTKSQPTNLAGSVHQRLLNLSRATGEDFNFLLTRFVIERLLYRLSESGYADQFVLKGALLFLVWDLPIHRPTRDLDLLGFGTDSAERLIQVFREVCLTKVPPDGLILAPESISVRPIRNEQAYGGQQIVLEAQLGRARIPVQIDIGFGDAIITTPLATTYPTLLEFPSPQIRVYPKESVIAEKVHAMIVLGMTNSRMKDLFDIWILAKLFQFDGNAMVQAIQATFARRQTPLPQGVPVAFTAEFSGSVDKNIQWQAFIHRTGLDIGDVEFPQVMAQLSDFLLPPLAVATDHSYLAMWLPGGPWVPPSA